MANAITKTTVTESSGTRDVVNIEGVKYSGSASGGGANWIESTALVGLVEENIVATGTGVRASYNDGSGTRISLYDAVATNFRTTVTGQMVIERTDTGVVTDTSIGGPYFDNRLRIFESNFPTSSTTYAVHGLAKVTPTDYTKCFQWNLIYITGGTGAGQCRRVRVVVDNGSVVKIFVQNAWSTNPDNTSTFVICWSPLDIHYASLAGAWGITQGFFDLLGVTPIAVELVGDLQVGINGTTTYFGWCDVYFWGTARIGQWGWGSGPTWVFKAPSINFVGEGYYGGVIPIAQGDTGVFGAKKGHGWTSGQPGFFINEAGAVVRLANARTMSAASLTSTVTALSYNSFQFYVQPYTEQNIREIQYYYGDYNGSPIILASTTIGGVATNKIDVELRQQLQVSSAVPSWAGLGWAYKGNAGDTGVYFKEGRNSNHHIIGYFRDAASRDVDYWGIARLGTAGYWQWVEKKSLDYTVVDAKSKLPISGSAITIKNIRGEVVSETDSGSDITADMTDSQITIDVDYRENFTTGDLIRVDNEYILLGTVSGTGAGTLSGITREYRLPNEFQKKIHKYNTVNFDKNIYKVGNLSTDSNGQVSTQWLSAFTMQDDSVGSAIFKSQVTNGGVNYTCKLLHQATAATEPGVGVSWATYWDVAGTYGTPWKSGKYYVANTTGATIQKSWTYHGAFTITVKKAGYITYSELFDPTIDYEATIKTVELGRPNLSLTDTAKFG